MESAEPFLMPVRSNAWVCGSSLAGIAGQNPPGARMSISFECWVVSDRGFCVRLIIHLEESYREWCVWVWLWSLDNEEALAH